MIELGLKGGLASMVVEEAGGEGELDGDTASVMGRRRVTGRAGNLPGVCGSGCGKRSGSRRNDRHSNKEGRKRWRRRGPHESHICFY
jgi:hypothetical protein